MPVKTLGDITPVQYRQELLKKLFDLLLTIHIKIFLVLG